jgi:hypothetical protein
VTWQQLKGLIDRAFTLIRQLQAALGGDRIVHGIVNDDGTARSGRGFTSAKTGTGLYEIDFDSPFTGPPTITLTSGTSGQDIRWDSVDENGATLTAFLSSPVTLADTEFSFTAIGPA